MPIYQHNGRIYNIPKEKEADFLSKRKGAIKVEELAQQSETTVGGATPPKTEAPKTTPSPIDAKLYQEERQKLYADPFKLPGVESPKASTESKHATTPLNLSSESKVKEDPYKMPGISYTTTPWGVTEYAIDPNALPREEVKPKASEAKQTEKPKEKGERDSKELEEMYANEWDLANYIEGLKAQRYKMYANPKKSLEDISRMPYFDEEIKRAEEKLGQLKSQIKERAKTEDDRKLEALMQQRNELQKERAIYDGDIARRGRFVTSDIQKKLAEVKKKVADIDAQVREIMERRVEPQRKAIRSAMQPLRDRLAPVLDKEVGVDLELNIEHNSTFGAYDPFHASGSPYRYKHTQGYHQAMLAKSNLDRVEQLIANADRVKAGQKWLVGAVHGVKDRVTDIESWRDLIDPEYTADEVNALKSAVDKYDKGQALTDAEELLLDTEAIRIAASEYFSQSWKEDGYSIGEITGESIPFMVEMAMNPISGSGSALTKGSLKLLKRFAMKYARSGVRKLALRGGATAVRLGGDVLGATGMSLTTGLGGVYEDAQRRAMGETKYGEDFLYAGHKKGEDGLASFGKATVARTIDNFTEMFPLTSGVSDMAMKGINKVSPKWFSDAIKRTASSDWAKGVDRFMEKTQWHGPIEEYFEEVEAGILNSLLVGDENIGDFFTWDKQVETFLGVALMGATISATKTLGYRSAKKEAKDNADKLDIEMRKRFGDAWDRLEMQLRNPETAVEALRGLASTPGLRSEALRYAEYRAKERGAELAEEKLQENNPEVASAHQSYEQGNATQSVEEQGQVEHNYQQARANAEQSLTPEQIEQLDNSPSSASEVIQEGADAQVVTDYVNARAAEQGMRDRVSEQATAEANANDEAVDAVTNPTTGNVQNATTKQGEQVDVIGGDLVTNPNGSVNSNASSGSVVIVHEDGRQEMVSPGELTVASNPISAEEQKAQDRADIEAEHNAVVDAQAQAIAEAQAQQQAQEQTAPQAQPIQAPTPQATQTQAQAQPIQTYEIDQEVEFADGTRGKIADIDENGAYEIETDRPINNRHANWFTPEELAQRMGQQAPTTEEATQIDYQVGDQVVLEDGTTATVYDNTGESYVVGDNNGVREVPYAEAQSVMRPIGQQTEQTQQAPTPTQSAPQEAQAPQTEESTQEAEQEQDFMQMEPASVAESIVQQVGGNTTAARNIAQSLAQQAQAHAESLRQQGVNLQGLNANEMIAATNAYNQELAQAEASASHWAQVAEAINNRPKTTAQQFQEDFFNVLESRAQELANLLHVNVVCMRDFTEVENETARDAIARGVMAEGWHIEGDTVYLYLPAYSSRERIDQVFTHETVGHYGVKQLFLNPDGTINQKELDAYYDRVWNMMTPAEQAEFYGHESARNIDETTEEGKLARRRVAADEYIAKRSESIDFYKTSAWQDLVEFIKDILKHKFGVEMKSNEVDDMLRQSFANLRNGNQSTTVEQSSAENRNFAENTLNNNSNEVHVRQEETRRSNQRSNQLNENTNGGRQEGVQHDNVGIQSQVQSGDTRRSDASTEGRAEVTRDSRQGGQAPVSETLGETSENEDNISEELDVRRLEEERKKQEEERKKQEEERKKRVEDFLNIGALDRNERMYKVDYTIHDVLPNGVAVYHNTQGEPALFFRIIETSQGYAYIGAFLTDEGMWTTNASNNTGDKSVMKELLSSVIGSLPKGAKLYERTSASADGLRTLAQQQKHGFKPNGETYVCSLNHGDEANGFTPVQLSGRNKEAQLEAYRDQLEQQMKALGMTREDVFLEGNKVKLRLPVLVKQSESGVNATEALRSQGANVDEQRGDVRFSAAYTPKGKAKEKFIADVMAVTERSRADVERYLKAEESLTAFIYNEQNAPFLDYRADDRYTAIKENSDYPQGTVDFNNICRKRASFTTIYDRLQREFPMHVFTGNDLAKIREVMKKNGMEVACGLCYVEDRRQLMGEIAESFIEELKGGFKDYASKSPAKAKVAEKIKNQIGEDTYIPDIADLITLAGSTELHKSHPKIYEAFNIFNNARGQQSANLFQGYAEYKREILKWSDAKVKKANDNGGLRIFSYSDFEAHHLIDIVQIINDCAARGVKIQGYTKVPAVAKVLANTNVKLNRSLIPLGDTGIKDGKLAYDPIEGIDINDKDFFESNDNVGNVLVGCNDEQIRMAMLDDFVHYIIPFHTNQKQELVEAKGCGKWTNYKYEQREYKDGKAAEKGVNIYTDVLNAAEKEGNPITNEREFTERFLNVCKERGLTPRFARFLNTDANGEYTYTPGYYKLLLDFKMFDANGNILPQNPIEANFDNQLNQEILADYVKGETAKLEEGHDAKMDKVFAEVKSALGLTPMFSAKEGTNMSPAEMLERMGTEAEKESAQTDNIRFSFIGAQGASRLDAAEGANKRLINLGVAQQMQDKGEDPHKIKLATGWEVGRDGKWRFEIPDVDIVKFPTKDAPLRLSDVVGDDNELIKAYPQIGDVIVATFEPFGTILDPEATASYIPLLDIIWFNPNKIDNSDEGMASVRSSLVHEIQHFIQSAEGFAAGGSPSMDTPEGYRDLVIKLNGYSEEKEAEWKSYKKDAQKHRRKLLNELKGYEKLEDEWKNATERTSEEFLTENPDIKERKNKINDELVGILEDMFVYDEVLDELKGIVERAEKLGYEGYRHLAGEVEARNVQERLNMSPEERLAKLAIDTDKIATEDQIFIFDSLNNAEEQSKSDIRFSFIGEKGAEALDRAEEATTRLDNLNVARDMEAQGKDAIAIKMATGWERGSDGKWRYETEDVKVVNPQVIMNGLRNGKSYSLSDVLTKDSYDRFISQYPEYADIKLEYDQQDQFGVGYWDKDSHTIAITKRGLNIDDEYLNSLLVHELQHAIQDAEGFAEGANPLIYRESEYPSEILHDLYLIRNRADQLLKKGVYKYFRSAAKNVLKEYVQRHWISDSTINYFGLKDVEGDSDVDNLLDDLAFNSAEELNRLSIEDEPKAEWKYRRTAGEVESRNVQKRLSMTTEERRASLHAETQDVADEDQIFIYDALESASDEKVATASKLTETVGDDAILEEGAATASQRAGQTMFSFAKTPEEFDAIRDEAHREKGIVIPNLGNTAIEFVDVKPHDFKGNLEEAREQAKKWAEDNLVYEENGKETRKYSMPNNGGTYEISKKAVKKYVDFSAINKSENAFVHLSALKELPKIISNSVEAEIHADYDKDENGVRVWSDKIGNKGLLVHRLYGAINLGDKVYRVKTTMYEYRDTLTKNTPHSYEVTKIELIEDSSVTPNDGIDRPLNRSTNSITGAKLLENVEKSHDPKVKLLDASENSAQTMFSAVTPQQDSAYLEAVKNGDMETAQRMVNEAAEKAGYTTSSEHKMSHRAPYNDGENPSMDRITELFPQDVLGPNGAFYYGHGKSDAQSVINTLKRAYGNPDAMVKVYRAVPASVKESQIRNGDWVTTSRAYAEEHGMSGNGRKKIIEAEVPAKHLWTDGNDIYEWGYDDGTTYAYQNTKNNRKLLDAVTYDDNGNVIPLSKRFNKRSGDVRFSVAPNASPTERLRSASAPMLDDVANRGLKDMFGKNYDTFVQEVYADLPEGERRKIASEASKIGWDFQKATEQYLASLADDQAFADINSDVWQQIRDRFSEMTSEGEYSSNVLNNNDLRYALWRNAENSTEKKSDGPLALASDIAVRERLEQGKNYPGGIRFAVSAPADIRSTYDARMKSSAFQSREALQDSMLALKEAMKLIKPGESIEDIADFENAYLGENRLSSVTKEEIDLFGKLVIDPMIKASAVLAPNEDSFKELVDYMMAKHGLERNAYMRAQAVANGENGDRDFAGLTALTGKNNVADAELDAQAMVNAYERNHNTADIKNLWGKVNETNKAILNKQKESGLIDQETYDKISNMYQYYIPLRGHDQKVAENEYAYMGQQGSGFAQPIKNAKGRSSKADNPFLYMQMMADSAIMQGNRNKLVKQRFLNFVLNNPSELVSVNNLWLKKDANGKWVAAFPDTIDENDEPHVVEAKMEAWEQLMEQNAKNYPNLYKKGNQRAKIPFTVENQWNKDQHHIIVMRAGKPVVLTVNGNPRLALAVNGLTNPDNKITGAVSALFTAGEYINRKLSSAYTSLNPNFVVSNFQRDMAYTSTSVWAKENAKYAMNFDANIAKMNPIHMRSLLHKYKHDKLDMNNKTERLFAEFMKNGGETGYVALRDIDKHRQDIKQAIKQSRGVTWKQGWDFFWERLDNVNRSVENCARFAAYVTSREQGRTIGRSIYDAKEISVNFNKKGAGARFMGKQGQTHAGNAAAFTAGLGKSLYAFWNPAIQGMVNYGRNFKKNPWIASGQAFSLFALGALASALAEGGDDDEEEKVGTSYFDLPEGVRRSNVVLNVGDGNFISWALPIEYRSIYGLGELVGSVAAGKEKKTKEEIAEEVFKQISGLMPLDIIGEGGNAFVPTWAKPAWEIHENVGYSGMPIYKDPKFGNENKPEWTWAYSKTNPWLVKGAKWLNENTGGNDHKKGELDWNPATIEHALRGYLGGPAQVLDQSIKTAEMIFGDREFNPSQVPIVNRVWKRGNDQTQNRRTNNKYWEYRKEAEKLAERVDSYKNDTQNGTRDYTKELDEERELGTFELIREYDKWKKSIKQTTDRIKKTNDEQKLRELQSTLLEKKKGMVKSIEAIKEKHKER